MDDIVRQAMAKWPNVPACYGWLALDARGGWYMRDDRVQAQGPFPASKGSLLKHDKLVDFIQRNYDRDESGQWYFQNGPQRVFVELEAAPLVLRIDSEWGVTDHTGRPGHVRQAVLDEHGRLFLETPAGLGLVHTMDMALAADAVERGLWKPQQLASAGLPRHFGFVMSPAARHSTQHA